LCDAGRRRRALLAVWLFLLIFDHTAIDGAGRLVISAV
jgi:hypothetical protein